LRLSIRVQHDPLPERLVDHSPFPQFVDLGWRVDQGRSQPGNASSTSVKSSGRSKKRRSVGQTISRSTSLQASASPRA
jgi:hypothetical protein